jgi:hypothetical protein
VSVAMVQSGVNAGPTAVSIKFDPCAIMGG